MKTLLTVLCLCMASPALFANDLALRLLPIHFDESSDMLYVRVEVKYEGAGFIHLADQNYRLYYDSQSLSIREDLSRSNLPTDIYKDLRFTQIQEGLEARTLSALPFDDDFGFINFDIEMINPSVAGMKVSAQDDWQKVAILNFEVLGDKNHADIVWSERGATDQYASAFVQISEWIQPNDTEPINVQTYVNGSFERSKFNEALDVKISPNPAVDFTRIDFGKVLTSEMDIVVYDITGKMLIKKTAYKGSSSTNLAVAQLTAGKYLVELRDTQTREIYKKEKLIKVK